MTTRKSREKKKSYHKICFGNFIKIVIKEFSDNKNLLHFSFGMFNAETDDNFYDLRNEK